MSRSSSTILEAIREQSLDARVVRSRRLGILAEIANREKLIADELCHFHHEADPEHVGNNLGRPFNYATQGSIFGEVLRLRLALEILEASDQYKIVVEKLDPLFAELAEAEAREAAERKALADAEAALREATEAARVKAEASVAKDASVKTAQAALNELKAKHPEHVVVPEPPEPSLLAVYSHGIDAARELAKDLH